MKKIPDNLLLLKNKKRFNLPNNYGNIRWLLPAVDDSFVFISSSHLLAQVSEKGETLFERHLGFPTIRAGMLSLNVVVVLSSRSLQLFDLKNHEEIKLVSNEISPVLWPNLTGLFIFKDMLFCVINFSQKEGESQLLYYDGQKILKEGLIVPVHTWKAKKRIKSSLVSKGNQKSKICWFQRIIKFNYSHCLETYEIVEGNRGVHQHYPLKAKKGIKFQIFCVARAQIWQYRPGLFLFSLNYLDTSSQTKTLKHFYSNQILCYSTESQLFFRGDEKTISQELTSSSSFSRGINLFPATTIVQEQYTLIEHQDLWLEHVLASRKFYLLENNNDKLELRYSWDCDCKKTICFADYNSDIIYEWRQAKGRVRTTSWTFATPMDIFVFFMTEMELDDDLIWDTIRLLFENQ